VARTNRFHAKLLSTSLYIARSRAGAKPWGSVRLHRAPDRGSRICDVDRVALIGQAASIATFPVIESESDLLTAEEAKAKAAQRRALASRTDRREHRIMLEHVAET
jgi:hypothetical protein